MKFCVIYLYAMKESETGLVYSFVHLYVLLWIVQSKHITIPNFHMERTFKINL